VRVGRRGEQSAGILGRRRALRQASEACEQLRERVRRAAERLEAARQDEQRHRAALDQARESLAGLRAAHRRAELEAAGLGHRVRACDEAERRQQSALEDLERSAGEQRARQLQVERDLEAAAGELAAREVGAAQAGGELEQAEGRVRSVATRVEGLVSALQKLREESAAVAERVRSAQQAQRASRRALEQAEQLLVGTQAELERVSTRRAELAQQSIETGQAVEQVAADQDQVAGRLLQERQRQRAARQRVGESEDALGRARDAREASAAELQRVELALNETRTRLDLVKRQGQEELGVSLPAMLDRLDKNRQLVIPHGLDDDERLPLDLKRLPAVDLLVVLPGHLEDAGRIETWTARVERSRKRLERLGDVNLTAVEEYLSLLGRHEDLESQRSDLERSVAEIRGALARINRTCRERFRTAFDEVNRHFEALFQRLAGGGKAALVLTDDEDLLETGVEIVASPPGKRLRHLSLLSGGEKALVALSLVFALFQVRPSPFCILDEVDAPLDEGNGARFNELLRDMSHASQFIIITHNKKTIECADTLYGVTMQDPGISRLVTVQVH